MSAIPDIAAIFRRLQAGDAAGALQASEEAIAAQPELARAHLARGIALRLLGRAREAVESLQHAAQLEPRDYAAAFETALAHQAMGEVPEALAKFHRAAALRADFFAAPFAAGLLQFAQGDWAGAARSFAAASAIDPRNVDALVNLGQALCEDGRGDEGQGALVRAVALAPQHAAARHALGWALHRRRHAADALPHFEAAAGAEPGNATYQLSLAKALGDVRREAEARVAYERAIALAPAQAPALTLFGRHCVASGDFARAAALFDSALALDPRDDDLPMFLAQVELLRGRWPEAWRAYAKREPRVRYERRLAAAGRAYDPGSGQSLQGRTLTLVAEQGLGDILFFLRWAPALRERGASLRFVGEPRLHTLLARTGLFEDFRGADMPEAGETPLLVADLPALLADVDPFQPPLSIPIHPDRERRWRKALERTGPRPWIGLTWWAGTLSTDISYALHKAIPVDPLLEALAPASGTFIALQRRLRRGELEEAQAKSGRALHDLSPALEDLEDAIAVVSLLDRHVGVSNTNMHLAASVGCTADVLVPFPPEWRWRIEGDSPWFAGFRVHRQSAGGDWGTALRQLPASSG